MLTESQYEEYVLTENVSTKASKVIKRIRESAPSRRVVSGKKNVSCRYPSKKMGVIIQAESHTNELAALYSWDHDDVTLEFYDQPGAIRLTYPSRDGARMVVADHTPDFFLLQTGYAGWVECKTEEHLHALAKKMPYRYQLDEHGVWRCPPGEEYAAQFGLKYRVRSSSENEVIYLRNLQFLSDYFDDDCPRPVAEVRGKVKSVFSERPWISLIDLVRTEGVSADEIYKLIADGDLYFSLYEEALAELEYARVYRDELSAMAYKLQFETKSDAVSLPMLTVKVEPGAELMWDGKPWKILNVGKTKIHLQNQDGGFFSLTMQEFDALLQSTQVRGLPESRNPVLEEQIQQILRFAGPSEMAEAMNRLKCLFPEQYGQPECPRGRRSVFYYQKDYREAEQLYGMGFLGLYPSTWKRGNRDRKINPAALKLIHEVIHDTYSLSHQPRRIPAWGELVLRCKEQALDVPSRQTFYGEIKRYSPHALEKARRGDRAAYRYEAFYWRIEVETPRHGDRPFDIVHIDHTQLDIELVDKRYGRKTTRPWLSIMIDANTRFILAIYLTYDPPSHRSCMMLMRECVRKHGRIPRVVVVDGGSEFKSVYFETLLANLSIMKKTRPAAKARFGSVMERVFETTNTQFIHNLVGNTQATRNPRTCSPSHNPKELAIWTLADLNEELMSWIEQVYSTNEKQVLGTSPLMAFERGLADFGPREHKRVIYSEDFVIQCLPTTKNGMVKVDPRNGIQVNHNQYWCGEFSDTSVHGKMVPVRYDPWDLSRAYAYVQHRWVLCRSEQADFYSRLTIREMHYATEDALFRLRTYEQVRQGNAANVAKGIRRASARELALLERRKVIAEQQEQGEMPTQLGSEPVAQDDWSDAIEQHTSYGAF